MAAMEAALPKDVRREIEIKVLKFSDSPEENQGIAPDWAELGGLYPPDGAP